MARQYVEVRYRRGDRRTYTFHNDGPAVMAGDTVKVPGRDGWTAVEVVSVKLDQPPFDTKPIMLPEEAPEAPAPSFGEGGGMFGEGGE